MRLAGRYSSQKAPRESVIFAGSQMVSREGRQEDFFVVFNDECFILADGSRHTPHGATASRLACETALWGYKHIRQHRFYWLDKKLFMKRIFRSTNMAVWQKRREDGFGEGLETTLIVLMIGGEKFWAGHAGDSSLWLYRAGSVSKLTSDDVDGAGNVNKILGRNRLGLIPSFYSDVFLPDDVLLMASASVANYLMPDDMQHAMGGSGNISRSMEDAVSLLLQKAKHNGSDDNMTALLVKRIRNY